MLLNDPLSLVDSYMMFLFCSRGTSRKPLVELDRVGFLTTLFILISSDDFTPGGGGAKRGRSAALSNLSLTFRVTRTLLDVIVPVSFLKLLFE
jgi:hypothetical protein